MKLFRGAHLEGRDGLETLPRGPPREEGGSGGPRDQPRLASVSLRAIVTVE